MSSKKIFPKTVLKTEDVLKSKGALSVGCYLCDGKLIPAVNNVTQLNYLMDGIKGAWFAAGVNKYVVYCGGYVWSSEGAMDMPDLKRVKTETPSFLELNSAGSRIAAVTGDTNYCKLNERNGSLGAFGGGVNNCVLKNGRIFGIDSSDAYKIKWSGEGGVEDWKEGISGAGWAVVQDGLGKILNLLVYGDKLVAVREYGLTLFTAFGTPENYSLENLTPRLPKIFKNTAAVAGTALWFYTEDGMYFYGGSKIEKAAFGLAEEISNPHFVTSSRGKLYLCGDSKTLKRRAALVYDAIHGYDYLIDVAADAMCAGDRIFAYEGEYEYELTTDGKYSFTSGELDFSSRGKKVLKEITVDAEGEVSVEVSDGRVSRSVEGVRGKFRPSMRGESFKITVTGDCIIDGVSAVAEVPYDL